MGLWPFDKASRKRRAQRRKARQNAKKHGGKASYTKPKGKPTPGRSDAETRNKNAARKAQALREARAEGKRTKATRSQSRQNYVPPPVPSSPLLVPAHYRAPEGPEVWQWLKTAPPDYFVEAWPEYAPEGYEDFSKWPQAEKPPRGVHSITRLVLNTILEAGKAQHPKEFGGMLRMEDGVVTELVLLPGTVSGDSHAIFQMHMLPVDMSIIGTVHTHPSPLPYPSAADTELFERNGRLHIIAAWPYGRDDWRAYDHKSHMVRLKVVE